MVLVVGGSFQGKLEYVKRRFAEQGIVLQENEIYEKDNEPDKRIDKSSVKVLNALHRIVYNYLDEAEPDAQATVEACIQWLNELLDSCPNLIIICDEVGYGIVPLEKKERCYREAVGRLLCSLAQRADGMERIVGGMPITIKGKGNTIWNLSGSDTE